MFTQGQILNSLIWLKDLNLSFPFLRPVEEFSLPYYLLIAGGRIVRFILFPRILALWNTALSISYDSKHYTTSIFRSGLAKSNSSPFYDENSWALEKHILQLILPSYFVHIF